MQDINAVEGALEIPGFRLSNAPKIKSIFHIVDDISLIKIMYFSFFFTFSLVILKVVQNH